MPLKGSLTCQSTRACAQAAAAGYTVLGGFCDSVLGPGGVERELLVGRPHFSEPFLCCYLTARVQACSLITPLCSLHLSNLSSDRRVNGLAAVIVPGGCLPVPRSGISFRRSRPGPEFLQYQWASRESLRRAFMQLGGTARVLYPSKQ